VPVEVSVEEKMQTQHPSRIGVLYSTLKKLYEKMGEGHLRD